MHKDQMVRDISAALIFVSSLAAFYFLLWEYLSALSRPGLMFYLFCFSLVINWLYDFKLGVDRFGLIRVLTTTFLYVFALVIADYYRHEVFLDVVNSIARDAEFAKAIGREYVQVAVNPAVGLGACLAGGMAVLRLVAYKRVGNAFDRLLIGRCIEPKVCEHCKQPVRV